MSVNRSGYYKWRNRKGKKNQYQIDRNLLTQLIIEIHEKHKSFGYHRIASFIKSHTGWIVSDNLVHKCCKFSNIKSKAKHYKKVNKGKENTIFTNVVAGDWNAGKPLELVASDMTRIRQNNILYEWTYILDTYNNEIISHHLSTREGDRTPYYQCLEDLKEKVKEQIEPVVLHTDQGSVYSSRAFKEAHKDYNIIRSMSRVGTPTDNPIIESINGWIKAEIRCDYTKADKINFSEFLDKYVQYFNNERPAYALGYLSPVQYRTEQGFP